MKLILIFLLSFSTFASEIVTQDVTRGFLYQQINLPEFNLTKEDKMIRLASTICRNSTIVCKNQDYLNKLVEAFLSAQEKYGIPAIVLQAIARIESSYVLNTVNPKSNDYGIMQVNEYHIGKGKFTKEKLLTDLQYSVNAGAKVFQWFYQTFPLEEAVKRYNCGTKDKCIDYEKVEKYLERFKRAL